MINRRVYQQLEKERLTEEACLSSKTKGRRIEEEECVLRTPFQRDRDRIIHAKAFRRLKHKTQVFIAPEGDHYRTRLTHTLEVSQIARTIGRGLGLNEDLIEAISLGHDLGHTPFGHAGEGALDEILPEGFKHNHQSLRVVDFLETLPSKRRGLNLTWEVRDGIKNHTGEVMPSAREGQVVRIADQVAYINHDIDDALRAGMITHDQLPRLQMAVLGDSHSQRINTMVIDIIKTSYNQKIAQSERIKKATGELRNFLFDWVYKKSRAREEGKIKGLLETLYLFYMGNPHELPPSDYGDSVEQQVVDYIAGMSDRFALEQAKRLLLPQSWYIF